MTSIDAEVRELNDRLAIADVIARYAAALDARDRERLRSCFTDDLRYEMMGGRVFEDPETAVDFILRAVSTYEGTQHHLGTQQIRLDGDRATASTSLWAALWRRNEDGGGALFHGGGYEDDLRRTAEGWRIARRRLAIPWRQDTRWR